MAAINTVRQTSVHLGLRVGVGPRVIISAFTLLPRGWTHYMNAVRKAAPHLDPVKLAWIRAEVGTPAMHMCDYYNIDYDVFWNRLNDELDEHIPAVDATTEHTLARLETVHDCQISVLSPVFGFTDHWWRIPTIFEVPLDSLHYGGRDVLVTSSLAELSGARNNVPSRFSVLHDSPFAEAMTKGELQSLYRGAGATSVMGSLWDLEDHLWSHQLTAVNPASK